MDLTTVVVLGAIGYFTIFGLGFLVRPELAARLAPAPTDRSGRTEIRCYYGAVSVGLGAYFAYLLAQDQADHALTGVLVLASAVLLTRVVGTAVDGGWREPYTRVAIPAETAMVLVLALAKAFG